MDKDIISIPTALGQALVDYLAGRPYREVAHLIAGLQQSASAPAKTAPEAAPEPKDKP